MGKYRGVDTCLAKDALGTAALYPDCPTDLADRPGTVLVPIVEHAGAGYRGATSDSHGLRFAFAISEPLLCVFYQSLADIASVAGTVPFPFYGEYQ